MRKAWTASRVRLEALKALAAAVGTAKEKVLDPNGDPVVTRTVTAVVTLESGFEDSGSLEEGPPAPQTVKVEVKELWGDYTVILQTFDGDWVGIIQGRYHFPREGEIAIRALRAADGQRIASPMSAEQWEATVDELLQGVWGKTIQQAGFIGEDDPMVVGGGA